MLEEEEECVALDGRNRRMMSGRYGIAESFRLFGRMDKLALLFHAMLLTTGVLFIYGAGLEVGGDLAEKWHKQLQWIALGSLLYVACAVVDYRLLGRYS